VVSRHARVAFSRPVGSGLAIGSCLVVLVLRLLVLACDRSRPCAGAHSCSSIESLSELSRLSALVSGVA